MQRATGRVRRVGAGVATMPGCSGARRVAWRRAAGARGGVLGRRTARTGGEFPPGLGCCWAWCKRERGQESGRVRRELARAAGWSPPQERHGGMATRAVLPGMVMNGDQIRRNGLLPRGSGA